MDLEQDSRSSPKYFNYIAVLFVVHLAIIVLGSALAVTDKLQDGALTMPVLITILLDHLTGVPILIAAILVLGLLYIRATRRQSIDSAKEKVVIGIVVLEMLLGGLVLAGAQYVLVDNDYFMEMPNVLGFVPMLIPAGLLITSLFKHRSGFRQSALILFIVFTVIALLINLLNGLSIPMI